jgi:hypothetical protein
MAARSGVKDTYANMMEQVLTMSAANTLTFEEIDIGLTLFDKVGILINRLEYEPPPSVVTSIIDNDDRWSVGLTADNNITGLDYSTRALIDLTELMAFEAGTPATLQVMQFPLIRDYSTLPGGGLLIAPKPLYLGLQTAGFAAASAVTVRIYFTILKLTPADYFELLESRRYFG